MSHDLKSPWPTVRPLLPRGGDLQRAEERQARTLLQGEGRYMYYTPKSFALSFILP